MANVANNTGGQFKDKEKPKEVRLNNIVAARGKKSF